MIGYPAFLNLQHRRCVVVGGGTVAARKTRSLLDAGAVVTVVSPTLSESLASLVGSQAVIWIARPYASGDLANAFLAVAATDDSAVNRLVVDDARASRVLVGGVERDLDADFLGAATVRAEDVVVAVGTGGSSPAFARILCAEIERLLRDRLPLFRLMAEVRPEVVEGGTSSPDTWREAIDDSLLGLVRNGDLEGARAALRSRLLAGGSA
jgi:siroheme synthase-like protein